MKIGIITIHHAKYSYGAILQALATSMVCKKYATDVDIINYENLYEQKGAKTQNIPIKQKVKYQINYVARMILFGGYKNQYRNSKNIDKIYGQVSPILYTNIQEMNTLEYDVMVTGSDQVWNPEITGGLDGAFFLDFGKAKRRISYAASMGNYIIPDSERNVFAEYLKRYDAISVREIHAKTQLQPLYDKDIHVVLDPTLLLTHDEWLDKFGINRTDDKKEPYILTFFVSNGFSIYWSDIKKYVEELNLPVWNIQSHERKPEHVERVICAPTVADFLKLIEDAAIVITNSFHGTAFSINFKKKFIPILLKSNPVRVQNLLDELGLLDRIDIPANKVKINIDYDRVFTKLTEKRRHSIMWLENAIKG